MQRNRSIEVARCPYVYGPEEDSELMLRAVPVVTGLRVLEMGCGTGFVALHCAEAGASVVAADLDPLAVRCASANAERNGIVIDVRESDLFSSVPEAFDLMIFNPPYLEGEVKGQEDLAWAGGAGGLEVLAHFLRQAPPHLLPGGRLLILVSSDMEQNRLQELLRPFDRRERASTVLFFETLRVLELSPAGAARSPS
jgi:release factor glutamine methyltransferase